MNHKGVYRTAPAKPGLLKTIMACQQGQTPKTKASSGARARARARALSMQQLDNLRQNSMYSGQNYTKGNKVLY